MNTLAIVSFACLAFFVSAKPGGYYGGHGAHVVPAGPTTLIGASGVVGPHGAAGPTGSVNGHGAVGPNGIPNAIHGGVVAGHGYLGGLGFAHAGVGPVGYAHAHDDGQWHGEGLWESQDHAGHAAAAYGHGAAAYGHGFGLGHGAYW
ncbi:hypothetical protein FQA39_LY11780 [Lamprigera yunnana]|nr:hypothetical protein FQA39_LY11780 [Lamprigera yunnana]